MPRYSYKARDITGVEQTGIVESAGLTAAFCDIREKGLDPFDVKPAAEVAPQIVTNPLDSSKILIVNHTDKTFMVNSVGLKILPQPEGTPPIVRDASLADDPDIMELRTLGYITVARVQPPQPPQQACQAELAPNPAALVDQQGQPVPSAQAEAPAKSKRSRRDQRRRRKRRQNRDQAQQEVQADAQPTHNPVSVSEEVEARIRLAATQEQRRQDRLKEFGEATSYADPNDPAMKSGGTVVVMTQSGPVKGKASPGLNNTDGPKFIGDQTPDVATPVDGLEAGQPTRFVSVT